MIATLVFALAALPAAHAAQDAAPPTPLTAGQIVSQMIARYHGATTMTGTVTYRVLALGRDEVAIQTRFQFENPSKIFIQQMPAAGRVRPVTVVSDGTVFTYPVPFGDGLIGEGEPLREEVNREGVLMTVREMYAVASRSLYDRNTALDIAFSRMEDLQFVRRQWATVKLLEPVALGGRTLHRIGGDWRAYGEADIVGQYEMLVSPEFDLVRFSISKAVGTEAGQPAQTVTEVWDVSIQVDGTPDQAKFKVG